MAERTSSENPLQWEPIQFFAIEKQHVKELALARSPDPFDRNRPFAVVSASDTDPYNPQVWSSFHHTATSRSAQNPPFFINQLQTERINTLQLTAPVDSYTHWRSTRGPKFVMLTEEHATDVSDKYKTASESEQWEVCLAQTQQCIEFIQNDFKQHQVFLICSGILGRDIVPKIHDLPQVYAIYVYCMNVDLHKQWTAKHAKIRVVCDDDEKDLLPQLAFDSAYCYYEYSCALIKQGKKELAKKKLEKAVKLLETQTRGRAEKEYIEMIKKRLQECV